ncbi:hypothetical protein MOKP4_06890 [Mycobacterium avium subsp. hominissuis]
MAVQADETAHEIPGQQGALPGLRVHPHHGVLGAKVWLLERLAKRPLGVVHGVGAHVVIAVGVQRPQVFGQVPQRLR